MFIVMGDDAANELRTKHTVLELETFLLEGKNVTAYCVIGADAVPLGEMPDLERLCRLHQTFIDSFNEGRYSVTLDAAEHLIGRFAGEMDSFYKIICAKAKDHNERV